MNKFFFVYEARKTLCKNKTTIKKRYVTFFSIVFSMSRNENADMDSLFKFYPAIWDPTLSVRIMAIKIRDLKIQRQNSLLVIFFFSNIIHFLVNDQEYGRKHYLLSI